jgi:hypothetical protein
MGLHRGFLNGVGLLRKVRLRNDALYAGHILMRSREPIGRHDDRYYQLE